VAGESYDFGGYQPGEHRDAVLAMLVEVHAVREAPAGRDDFVVPHRDVLEASLGGAVVGPAGPLDRRAAAVVADNALAVRRLLDRYDALAAAAAADPGRAVLTHGEPHRGNTLRTPAGWKLIDWDTALIAPPERDLWLLGDDLSAYASATGGAPRPELLEMYRLRWEIADLAMAVDRFRRPHTGSADDEKTFEILCDLLATLDR
jgi:aminoglycoside phosphotransferase (APT) family kinase protein